VTSSATLTARRASKTGILVLQPDSPALSCIQAGAALVES
jgi:hypothetical protein